MREQTFYADTLYVFEKRFCVYLIANALQLHFAVEESESRGRTDSGELLSWNSWMGGMGISKGILMPDLKNGRSKGT